ncbi:hypothetical protein PR048_025372 [Dryococelus australis]|uniref:Uncharacterized protein n=1 Tax=Dryococelus australis TaxID=614101 RepID=A0ABQ9GR55_9NEOP|nr:hypothetical protein PR048_025372 [Dryococelus australis]
MIRNANGAASVQSRLWVATVGKINNWQGKRDGRCRWPAGFRGEPFPPILYQPGRSLPDFRMWESYRMMPLVGGFSRGSLATSPPLHSGAAPHSPRFTLTSCRDLDVKRRTNLSTSAASASDRASFQPPADIDRGLLPCRDGNGLVPLSPFAWKLLNGYGAAGCFIFTPPPPRFALTPLSLLPHLVPHPPENCQFAGWGNGGRGDGGRHTHYSLSHWCTPVDSDITIADDIQDGDQKQDCGYSQEGNKKHDGDRKQDGWQRSRSTTDNIAALDSSKMAISKTADNPPILSPKPLSWNIHFVSTSIILPRRMPSALTVVGSCQHRGMP